MKATKCPECGISFGLTDEFHDELRETGRGFFCPKGHRLAFGPSEVDRLKEALRERDAHIIALENRITQFSEMNSNIASELQELRKELGVVRRKATIYRKRIASLTEPETGESEE